MPLVAARELKGSWFDASVANQDRGTDVTSIEDNDQRGTWSANGGAKGTVESRLGVRYIEVRGDGAAGDRLRFTPDDRQKERRVSVAEMAVCFDDVISHVAIRGLPLKFQKELHFPFTVVQHLFQCRNGKQSAVPGRVPDLKIHDLFERHFRRLALFSGKSRKIRVVVYDVVPVQGALHIRFASVAAVGCRLIQSFQ